ncbi:MAG TPA: DUF4388 domain-containing protein [Geopsychrobacteraceae bacterium]|nr:DUF4388 domain-containing protein [Geopsychrobacteraceae bacterium]
MEAQLKGNISFMPLPDLLQWLETNKKSGELSLSGKGVSQSFYFEEGSIIFVSSSKEGQRFGEVLAQGGTLEEMEVELALVQSQKQGVCFTQYLIEKNKLPKETLTENLIQLAEIILMEVVSQPNCRFSFVEVLPEVLSKGTIRIATGRLIMNSLRKMDELNWQNGHSAR